MLSAISSTQRKRKPGDVEQEVDLDPDDPMQGKDIPTKFKRRKDVVSDILEGPAPFLPQQLHYAPYQFSDAQFRAMFPGDAGDIPSSFFGTLSSEHQLVSFQPGNRSVQEHVQQTNVDLRLLAIRGATTTQRTQRKMITRFVDDDGRGDSSDGEGDEEEEEEAEVEEAEEEEEEEEAEEEEEEEATADEEEEREIDKYIGGDAGNKEPAMALDEEDGTQLPVRFT